MIRLFKPAPGCRVRHEDGTLFRAEGEPIRGGSHYARLIADGDLIPADAPQDAKTTTHTAKRKSAVQPTLKGE